jgi:DNA helicase HerA-like ATPase
MAETEQITVATTSAGPGGTGEPGETVDLPVVELLTGRGFITGKSGSGKSNTASVVAEKLLDNGFGLLIVDIDGEYYGLKEEYEILHVGGDEECDIQVTEDHAGKIASLALEQNVPIILDISSFLDEEEAETLLTEVAKQLFAKAKKQKQPFLMLVEECHEWMPEKGSMGEVGKMLIKIGKRGRKHGLGIVGISQRPADVKKDYITQCDWLVWHRLTWNNDTKVVGRILDSKYADAVEDLDDGEAFMMNDWAEQVSRVQFHRKQTFDAGATPGLDDFERPELKSVSDDLVSELETISEDQQATENRIKELREELDKKNSRIAELEAELQDARDLSRMAEQFTEAMLDQAEDYNPGRTEQEKLRRQRGRFADSSDSDGEADADSLRDEQPPEPDETADATSGGGFGDAFSAFAEDGAAMNGGSAGDDAASNSKNGETATNGSSADAEPATNGHADSADAPENAASASGAAAVPMNEQAEADIAEADDEDLRAAIAEAVEAEESSGATGSAEDESPSDFDGPAVYGDLRADIEELERKTRRMLAYYREQGPGTPLNAHFSAGGSGDRTAAYARNRELRLRGLVEHVGRGKYDARLADLVRAESDRRLDGDEVESVITRLESAFLDGDGD